MKKFIKALAFATVMCMLLSTAAFATNPDVVLSETDYVFDVTVATESDEAEQVSLLIVKKDANLASLQNADILFVGQTVSASRTARFDGVTVATGNDVVDVYAGYASNTNPAAASYKGVSVVNEKELAITLVTSEIVNDVTTWEKLNELTEEQKATLNAQLPEREIASMVRAKVNFANVGTNVIDRVGWEFETAKGSRFAELDAAGYGKLDGDVLIGVSFANGWKADFAETAGYIAHEPITGVKLYFRVNDGTDDEQHIQAIEKENN